MNPLQVRFNPLPPGELSAAAQDSAFHARIRAAAATSIHRARRTAGRRLRALRRRVLSRAGAEGAAAVEMRWRAAVREIEGCYDIAVARAESECLIICERIVRSILNEHADAAVAALPGQIRSALGELVRNSRLSAAVHPADRDRFLDQLRVELPELRCEIETDGTRPRGTVLVRCRGGSIELNWEHYVGSIFSDLHAAAVCSPEPEEG